MIKIFYIGIMPSTIESHPRASSTRRSKAKFHLVWLAENIDELKKTYPESFTFQRNIDSAIDTFSDADLFMNFLLRK